MSGSRDHDHDHDHDAAAVVCAYCREPIPNPDDNPDHVVSYFPDEPVPHGAHVHMHERCAVQINAILYGGMHVWSGWPSRD